MKSNYELLGNHIRLIDNRNKDLITEQVLGIKTVLMGFGLEQNAIHSPNESQELEIFFKGIESVAEFYRIYK